MPAKNLKTILYSMVDELLLKLQGAQNMRRQIALLAQLRLSIISFKETRKPGCSPDSGSIYYEKEERDLCIASTVEKK